MYKTVGGTPQIHFISGTTNSQMARIPLEGGSNSISVNSATNLMYVALQGLKSMTVINGATNTAYDPTIITVDTQAPTLSITSPANQTLTGSSTVPVTGTASDDTSVTSVTYKVDTGSVLTATGTTSWSFTTAALSNGLHNIRINATDAAGLVTQKLLQVTVDNVAPNVSIT